MARRIRKQVDELSAADFEAHPCWEYADDEEGREGQDECTVRPLSPAELARATQQVWVQALFFFPNGRFRPGMVTLKAGADAAGRQPVLFLPNTSVTFYHGSRPPGPAELKRFLAQLRKVSPAPLPVHYASTLHNSRGAPLAKGTLDGLYWMADWRTGVLRAAS
jgi:hypothetical protein